MNQYTITSPSPSVSDTEFDLFQKLLTSLSGIDISMDKRKVIAYAVEKRRKALAISTTKEYYTFLMRRDKNKGEFQKLINEITIKETYFYRHPLHFEVLQYKILPELINSKINKGKKIRMWSAGCATGEEVYTLAMICYELGIGDRKHVDIIGTDIDDQAISYARNAVYAKRSFRVKQDEFLPAYFRSRKNCSLLNEHLRRLPYFYVHNLVQTDNLPFQSHNFNVIFCRNVMIYLQNNVIEALLDFFYSILEDGGILILGGTETLNLYRHKFSDVLNNNTFYYQKDDKHHPVPLSAEHIRRKKKEEERTSLIQKFNGRADGERIAVEELTEETDISDKKTLLFEQAMVAFTEENFTVSREKLLKLIEKDPHFPGAKILLCEVAMNVGDYPMTITLCKKLLENDPLNADAYYILGCMMKKDKDDQAALDYFRRSVYLNPELAMAHFSLANIFRDQDDSKNARRSYFNTIKALKKLKEEDIIKFASGFSRDILVRTCERNIQQLDNDV